MTKEQIDNLRIGDEIWLAKFKLGYDQTTHEITALHNYHPRKFVIQHYICDGCDKDFHIVGFEVLDGRHRMSIDSVSLLDNDISEHIKYATSENEITEWYENHKREQKEAYMKQLENTIRSVEVSR